MWGQRRAHCAMHQRIAHRSTRGEVQEGGKVTKFVRQSEGKKTPAKSGTASPSFVHESGGAGLLTEKTGITIVVPCFNEELALRNLRDCLQTVQGSLGQTYSVSIVLVDDGSTDKTWKLMHELFGSDQDCVLLRQPRNLGLAAAI